jgi:hypothetical protein
VYEYDGPAWQRSIDERLRPAEQPRDANAAKAMADQAEADRVRGTRLWPVDAGPDPGALRRQYPDRSRDIIVPAVVSIHQTFDPLRRVDARRFVSGTIRAVTTSLVVPRELRAALERAEARPTDAGAPRYSVKIAYGTRYEPWIVSIRPVDTPAIR